MICTLTNPIDRKAKQQPVASRPGSARQNRAQQTPIIATSPSDRVLLLLRAAFFGSFFFAAGAEPPWKKHATKNGRANTANQIARQASNEPPPACSRLPRNT